MKYTFNILRQRLYFWIEVGILRSMNLEIESVEWK